MSFTVALGRPPSTTSEPAKTDTTSSITIPAGTHLLMRLIRPLHTTSATPGSGVYLETSFPVVADNLVAIPEKTRVLGVVDVDRRPGRTHGRARLRMRFTEFILPDNHTYAMSGNLQSLPGSSSERTSEDGTIEPVDQIDADVYTIAGTTTVGLLFGSIHHIGIGLGPGAAIGFGLGLAKVLFTRGDEIVLPVGTEIETVLKHPVIIQSPIEAPDDSPKHDPTTRDSTNHERTDQELAPQRSGLGGRVLLGRNGTDVKCPICE